MFKLKKYRFILSILFFTLFLSISLYIVVYAYNVDGDANHIAVFSVDGEGVNPRTSLNFPKPISPGGKEFGPQNNAFDKTAVWDPDAADPVDMVEGNFHHTVTDMFIPTSGLPLTISRTYHSRTKYEKGYFGFGWTSLFDMSITETADNAVLRQADGTVLEFKMDSTGIFKSPKGWNLSLIKVATEDAFDTSYENVNYTLKEPNGTEYKFYYHLLKASVREVSETFSSGSDGPIVIYIPFYKIDNGSWQNADVPGKPQGLQSINDRYGNSLVFSYTLDYIAVDDFSSRVRKVEVTHYPSLKNITLDRENYFTTREISVYDAAEQEYRYKFNSDGFGNLENVINPLEGVITYTYNLISHNLLTIENEKDNVYIDNSYDTIYDRVSNQSYNGGTYKFNYSAQNSSEITDRRGNKTVYFYDTTGNITRVEEPLNIVTIQTYDTSNNKLKSVELGNHKTTYGYDTSGNITQVDKYVSTNVSYRTNYEYETAFNQIKQITRSKYDWSTDTQDFIDTTFYKYGDSSELSYVVRGYGTELADTTFFEYYESEGVWRYDLPVKISNSVNTVEYEYDSNGWVTAIKTNALVEGVYKKRILRRDYNDLGNVVNEQVCIADIDGSNEITKSESILTYDVLNQLREIKDSTGITTKFDYDPCGNLDTTTNAEGLITESIYNEYDQLKAVVRRSNEVVYDSAGYGYDSSENLRTITDALGRTTSYEYDELGRVKTITDPLNNITQFGYDQWGNLTSKITPNNKTITYEYDWLNRMTRKKYIGIDEEFNYTYKDDTRLITSASSPAGTITYNYDELYRLKQVIDPYYNTTTYGYDEGNRRQTMTVSKTNEVYQYVYDSSNQLTSIDNHGTFNFEYDDFGWMSKKTMANGTYTEFQSDHLGRLKELINYNSNNSVISQYLSQAGDFDSVGNRKKVSTLDGNFEYNYDSVYQLTESKVNNVISEEYQYDSVGNRLTSQLASEPPGMYNYDLNNRLSGITGPTGISYDYDDNGSRITKTENDSTTSYTYDYENRLKRIDFVDSSYAEYTYDALGRRIEKTRATSDGQLATYRYSYDGEDIIAVLDSTNTAIASITHGPGIDHPLSYRNIATGQSYHYHQDYLGSITGITDSNQNIVETYKYDAFGNLLTTNDYSLTTVIYSYTGREYDPESGLYFYRFRYYDSKIGRFLESDPIRFLGGMNFYMYVGNNPVNLVDPLGLCWREPTKEERENLQKLFPNLKDFMITGEPTDDYNCIAWTLGITDDWVWPGNSLSNFDDLYQNHGYKSVQKGEAKIAVFTNNGAPTHGAVRGENGWWESKLGKSYKIKHKLSELEGGFYGNATKFYGK